MTPRLPQKRPSAPAPPTVPAALFLCIVCGGGFFGLLSMVFPGAGLLFVAQYFVWGKWLYAYVVRKEQEASARTKAGESDDDA